MGEQVWIGVDLGTQSVRALAVDDVGTVRAAASVPLHSHRSRGPDGGTRHEQDPREWVRAVTEVLAAVAAGLDDDPGPTAIGGIAVDATSGTIVLLDGSGPDARALTPGVMYDDDRGAAHAPRAQDVGEAVWTRLGHRIGPSWALPTAMALLAEHPGGHLRHQSDVVTGFLVGDEVATDATAALKTGYDVDRGRWPVEVLAELGLDPARMPAVVTPGRLLGTIGAGAAAATGIPAGVPVVAGTTDGCAAQLGAGAVAPGTWNAVLGTTLIVKGVSRELLHDPTGTVYCHRAPQGGWWWPGGASSTGAGALAEVLPGVGAERLAALGERPPPADLPPVYPLAGRGERFPFAVPEAHGFWLDGEVARPLGELAGAVGEAAALAAVGEGIAVVEALCLERVAALGAETGGTRTISGGATANRSWNQRRADVAGVPLHRPASAEPAFGMAVLARAGVTDPDGPDVVAAAEAMVRVAEVIEPRASPALAAAIAERAARMRAAWRVRGWLG